MVRRELSDNFCLHSPDYDTLAAAPDWARRTLDEHRDDPRAHLYAPGAFEAAATHDPLWNAAQNQMRASGGMHGYLRMYWAKKILEWSPDPESALATAIALNDRYQLDGRDPNGYRASCGPWPDCTTAPGAAAPSPDHPRHDRLRLPPTIRRGRLHPALGG